jgi:hypothetical protein
MQEQRVDRPIVIVVAFACGRVLVCILEGVLDAINLVAQAVGLTHKSRRGRADDFKMAIVMDWNVERGLPHHEPPVAAAPLLSKKAANS